MASRHCTDGTPSGIRCNGMESSLGSCLSSHLFSSIAVRRFYAALTRITRPTTRARWCKRQEEQIIPCKMVYQGERKQSARQIDACWLSNTGALPFHLQHVHQSPVLTCSPARAVVCEGTSICGPRNAKLVVEQMSVRDYTEVFCGWSEQGARACTYTYWPVS